MRNGNYCFSLLQFRLQITAVKVALYQMANDRWFIMNRVRILCKLTYLWEQLELLNRDSFYPLRMIIC